MIRLPVNQSVANGFCRVIDAADWVTTEHPGVPGEGFKSLYPGRPIVLSCSKSVVGLRFLKHDWSGSVNITFPGGSQIIDLSSKDIDVNFVFALPEKFDQEFQISVCSIAQDGREQSKQEVWLLGLLFDDLPSKVSGSYIINRNTKIVSGVWGDFLTLLGDQIIPDAIVKHGSWAPADIEIFEAYVQEGDFVLDVGSNFGHHAIVFSKLVGADGLVIAIEAQRLMYYLVNANAAINGCHNITALHAAAGDSRGKVSLYPVNYDTHTNLGSLGINIDDPAQWSGSKGEEVDVHLIDDLIPPYAQNRRLSFVKIDVQSYELFVLNGMIKIISKDKPTIFIEISPVWMKKAGYDYRDIYSLLSGLGYQFIHREGTEVGEDGIPLVLDGEDIEWDLLALHPDRPVEPKIG
jgi:FkbM family methyltransferase